MNYLGHNAAQPQQPSEDNPLAAASHSRTTPAKPFDPQREIRSLDKETRKDLVKLGVSAEQPLNLKAAMPFPQLSRALEHTSSESRINFITPFATAALEAPHLKSYVLDKLPFLLPHLTVSEKGDLIRDLFNSKAGKRRDRYEIAAEVFRACEDFHDFKEVCHNVGPQFIRRTRSAQILDIQARYEFLDALKALRIPPALQRSAKADHAECYLDELNDTLKEARRIINSDPLLAHTPFGKHMRNIITSDLRHIRRERENAEDAADLRELANSMAAKIKLEFRYGIAITARENRGELLVEPWSTAELSEMSKTLRRFPECLIILSKHLTTIRKSPDSELSTPAETVYGLWTEADGLIQLREGLHSDTAAQQSYGGKSPLGVILTHEFAHVVESDRGYDIAQAKLEDGRNPPLFHSSEYRQISGWSVVDKSKYHITHGGKSVVIDGVSYRLEHDVAKLGGKDVFLVYHNDTRTMFSHPVRAEWSLDDYSRANPSEDFAVSFAEYFRLPKQLAEFAPSKFLIFEHQFQEYADQPEIMAAVASSHASRLKAAHGAAPAAKRRHGTERRPLFEDFMVERFDQMTRGEQSWLLANLRFMKEERTDTSQIFALYRAYKEVLPIFRRTQFVQFAHDPAFYSGISDVMLDILKPYKPAHLALLAARLRGAEIGVLTLRSSREGNAAHIDAIEKFSGYTFQQRNIYFVSDEKYNERIRHIPSGAAKKAHILSEFAAGEYTTADGEVKPLRRQYDRVIFFEDEPKNIEAARRAAQRFPDGSIVVIDAHKPNAEGIWRSICSRLLAGKVHAPNSKKEIVFFDLDGTMFDVAAAVSVVDKSSGKVVRRISQQEFSAKDESTWFDEIAAADVSIDRQALALDYSDFTLAERVAQQINFPRHLRRLNSKEIRRQNRLDRTGRASE